MGHSEKTRLAVKGRGLWIRSGKILPTKLETQLALPILSRSTRSEIFCHGISEESFVSGLSSPATGTVSADGYLRRNS